MARYKVEVDFDDCSAVQERREQYFKALDFYKALGIGHKETGTSTIFCSIPRKDLAALVAVLGDVKNQPLKWLT
ncbi:MAG: hypothetical protein AABX07_03220 [Nanoarchaeota archaeon]